MPMLGTGSCQSQHPQHSATRKVLSRYYPPVSAIFIRHISYVCMQASLDCDHGARVLATAIRGEQAKNTDARLQFSSILRFVSAFLKVAPKRATSVKAPITSIYRNI